MRRHVIMMDQEQKRERVVIVCFFFFNDTATTEIYTLSLHDALPILQSGVGKGVIGDVRRVGGMCALELVTDGDASKPNGEMAGKILLEARQRDRKSTRLNSSHTDISRMPSSA